jgi:Holliday junction DNA helicase RuvA
MIVKLNGRLDEIGEDWLLIDVGGVGYEVHCPARTIAAAPEIGSAISLHIETHVREDQIRLYGFFNTHERSWFRHLQSVQGIGARVALAILGTLSTSELGDAIALSDTAVVTRTPGVGPKVAQRIISELKDKVLRDKETKSVTSTLAGTSNSGDGIRNDAISALINLGYSRAEATMAIAGAIKVSENSDSAGELIRIGLKELDR